MRTLEKSCKTWVLDSANEWVPVHWEQIDRGDKVKLNDTERTCYFIAESDPTLQCRVFDTEEEMNAYIPPAVEIEVMNPDSGANEEKKT